jgi:N6-adenosine-specific RNA methylase IME4
MKYKTVYADPPWPEYGGGKLKRGADRHYPLMKVTDIIALGDDLGPFLDPHGCHLYLWATNNYLPEALEVMKAWGFEYKTTITWMKDRFGIGQYFRGQSEHCLFGTRGSLPYNIRSDGKRGQGKTAFVAPRSIHSRKPQEMREMIEVVSYAPRLELFAREEFAGWDKWGNQVRPDIILGGALQLPMVA